MVRSMHQGRKDDEMKLIKEFFTLGEARAFMDRDRRDLFCERCMFSGRYQVFDMG